MPEKNEPKTPEPMLSIKIGRTVDWVAVADIVLLNKAQIEYMYIIVYTQFLTVASYTYMYIYIYIYISLTDYEIWIVYINLYENIPNQKKKNQIIHNRTQKKTLKKETCCAQMIWIIKYDRCFWTTAQTCRSLKILKAYTIINTINT